MYIRFSEGAREQRCFLAFSFDNAVSLCYIRLDETNDKAELIEEVKVTHNLSLEKRKLG